MDEDKLTNDCFESDEFVSEMSAWMENSFFIKGIN